MSNDPDRDFAALSSGRSADDDFAALEKRPEYTPKAKLDIYRDPGPDHLTAAATNVLTGASYGTGKPLYGLYSAITDRSGGDFGDRYLRAKAKYQSDLDMLNEGISPLERAGGELVGGIASMAVPVPGLGAAKTVANASRLTRAVIGIGKGLTVGAGSSAINGRAELIGRGELGQEVKDVAGWQGAQDAYTDLKAGNKLNALLNLLGAGSIGGAIGGAMSEAAGSIVDKYSTSWFSSGMNSARQGYVDKVQTVKSELEQSRRAIPSKVAEIAATLPGDSGDGVESFQSRVGRKGALSRTLKDWAQEIRANGLDANDPELKAAVDWFQKNGTPEMRGGKDFEHTRQMLISKVGHGDTGIWSDAEAQEAIGGMSGDKPETVNKTIEPEEPRGTNAMPGRNKQVVKSVGGVVKPAYEPEPVHPAGPEERAVQWASPKKLVDIEPPELRYSAPDTSSPLLPGEDPVLRQKYASAVSDPTLQMQSQGKLSAMLGGAKEALVNKYSVPGLALAYSLKSPMAALKSAAITGGIGAARGLGNSLNDADREAIFRYLSSLSGKIANQAAPAVSAAGAGEAGMREGDSGHRDWRHP